MKGGKMVKSYKFIYAAIVLVLVLSLGTVIAPLQINVQGVKADDSHSPQLSHGFVNPGSGDPSTNFYYYITYHDSEGISPELRQVYIDGIAREMSLLSGSASNGVYCSGPRNLAIGSHDYWFYFEDGEGGTARLPTSGSYSGPVVSPRPAVTWSLPWGLDGDPGAVNIWLYPGDAVQVTLAGVETSMPDGLLIWHYGGPMDGWRFYKKGWGASNTLATLAPGEGYIGIVPATGSAWEIPQG